MTKEFKYLLHLLSRAALGTSVTENEACDFAKVYKLAKAQQVDTVIFPLVSKMAEQGEIFVDVNLLSTWSKQFDASIFFAFQRGMYISGLVKKLEERNIRCCILKGTALSELYNEPDTRISSDVDLWIYDAENMDCAMEILRNDGFVIETVRTESHQIECRHKTYGLIELHSDICDRAAKQIWFENRISFSPNFIRKPDGYGGYIYVMPITDGAIFVTFHFIKHFLSHGCGCRQLTDMLLYLQKHEKEIDDSVFDTLFGDLKYLKFIHICKQIGNLYFGMHFDVQEPVDPQLCEAVLTDIENGGVFGYDEEFRKDFSYDFTARRSGSAKELRLFNRTINFIKNRNGNLVTVVRDLRKRSKNRAANAQKKDERLELFETLGFFDNTKKV